MKAVDFFMAHRPSGDFWVRGMTRERKPVGEPVTDFYPNLFIANGLAEFSKAAGEPKYWDLAKETFGRMYRYVLEKFPLKKHGYLLWISGGDRKVTFVPRAERVDIFHHPRHLMLNLLALKRMMHQT